MKQKKEYSPLKNIRISESWEELSKTLSQGKIAVAPTDTLYGILADALNKDAVERIYLLKKRKPDKPYIILIPDTSFLQFFCIKPSKEEKKLLEKRGITVVLDLPEECSDKFLYLHRGKRTLAFRIPDKKELIHVMKKIKKPLVAPSTNPEGKPPAKDIKDAVEYFKGNIDIYIDKGKLEGKPSTIVKVEEGCVKKIREGKTPISQINHILRC